MPSSIECLTILNAGRIHQEIRATDGFVRSFYEEFVGELIGDGDQVKALCPFHEDRRESLSINLRSGLWHCFGCSPCNDNRTGGDIFLFYSTYREKVDGVKLSFPQVLSYFQHRLEGEPAGDIVSTAPLEEAAPILPTFEEIEEWSHALLCNPDAESYRNRLRARGLTDETLRRFKIGYDGSAMVVPAFEENPHLAAMVKLIHYEGETRRILSSGSTKTLFNAHEVACRPDELVHVCEGEFDAMIAAQHGLLAVSSCGGQGTWDNGWADRFFKNRDVAIVYDSDEPGRKGSQKVVEALKPHVRSIRNVDLFHGSANMNSKDITDWFRQGKGLRAFQSEIQKTLVFQNRPFQELLNEAKKSTDPKEKAALLKNLVGLLSLEKDEFLQATYSKALKKEFGLKEAQLKQLLLKTSKPTMVEDPSENSCTVSVSDGEDSEGLTTKGRSLCDRLREMKDRRDEDESLGELVYRWIRDRGGRFFKHPDQTKSLAYNGRLLRLSADDREFTSLFYELTGHVVTTRTGRTIIEVLDAKSHREAVSIESIGWIRTDVNVPAIYFNLGNEAEQVVRIDPAGPAILDNGANEHDVFVRKSQLMKPLNYVALSEVEFTDALKDLDRLVVKNLPCGESDQIFCFAWTYSAFLIGFARTKPLLRLQGSKGMGKSTAMDLLYWPLYGEEAKLKPTDASLYSMSEVNPMLPIDNLEVKHLRTGMKDFMLLVATGINKAKRDVNTKRDVILERPNCLLATNGIEPLSESELISRLYIVECNRAIHHTAITSATFREIGLKRDRLMSAVFRLLSGVLAKIQVGEQTKLEAWIQEHHPGHSKERTNEFLALMVLLAEAYCQYCGIPFQRDITLKAWIDLQASRSKTANVDSNQIVQCLDVLKAEYRGLNQGGSRCWDYSVSLPVVEDGRLHIRGLARDLYPSITKAMERAGIRCEFKSSGQLASRIRDSIDTLKDAGWEVVGTPDRTGTHVWDFSSGWEE